MHLTGDLVSGLEFDVRQGSLSLVEQKLRYRTIGELISCCNIHRIKLSRELRSILRIDVRKTEKVRVKAVPDNNRRLFELAAAPLEFRSMKRHAIKTKSSFMANRKGLTVRSSASERQFRWPRANVVVAASPTANPWDGPLDLSTESEVDPSIRPINCGKTPGSDEPLVVSWTGLR